MDRDMPKMSPQEAQQRENLRSSHQDDDQDRQFAVEAAGLLNDFDCEDVMVLDVRGMSNVTNFLVLATGTSDRQIRSLGGRVKDLARDFDLELFGHERDDQGEGVTWVVLDFVNVVVHLFDPAARAHYDLEMLWGDAERIKWRGERKRTGKPEPKPDSEAEEADDQSDSSSE